MDEFNSAVQKFMRKPGFLPLPPDVNAGVISREHERIAKILEKIRFSMEQVEKYLPTDVQRAKIELFTLEYLYHQIPESYKTKLIVEQVRRAVLLVREKENENRAKSVEHQKIHDLTLLEEINKEKEELASLDRAIKERKELPRTFESEKAIKQDASSTKESLYEKGLEYLRTREYEKAKACFSKVLQIAPNHVAARIRLQQIPKR